MKLAGVLTLLSAATAAAQPSTTTSPPQPTTPQPTPAGATEPQTTTTLDPNAAPPQMTEEEKKKKKEPKRGDVNIGGQARFPSGPDETGDFASFNWVAADLQARYYLFKAVTLNANVPLAVVKPDTVGPAGPEPSLFGGLTVTLDARVAAPKMPGVRYDTVVGLNLTVGYMKQGAMLLSDKDYPLFVGDMKVGFAIGVVTRVKLSKLVDFALLPTWVYQSGEPESLTALQIPLALEVAVSSLAKVSAQLGVYTGDNYKFSRDEGGRITTGAALDLKLGRILFHAGAGVASLLTGDMAMYPTIKDSFYVDVNVKYTN